ncbi:MAG TPA: ABC transporter substrate-binding protein [Terriglobales bacterium]|nr:ABC transporter substrate-binding protein [Terriglobales bacterium]
MKDEYIPKRIVCLQPSATVILASIGELARVVACTKYCHDLVPEIRSALTVIVSDSWTAQEHEILAVKPDLVIASVPYQENAVSQILRAGIRFLGLAPRTLNDIYKDIFAIAGTVHAYERGNAVIEHMQIEIGNLQVATRNLPLKNVFCEEWGKPLIASQPWVEELVSAAGGRFVGQAGKQLSPEEVLARDPDVLVAAWCGAGNRVPLEKIVRDRGWQKMKAVTDGNVFCIPDEYLNTPAPSLMKGLRALAHAIRPELFPVLTGVRRITDVSHNDSRSGQG